MACNLKKPTSIHGQLTAVSMMKDEAPYLLEWFAHHLAVGFTDIVVYTNDCSDGTDTMLMRLEDLGLGHHRRNVIPKDVKPQPSALKHAQKEPLVQASDWVLVFDADEFLCIKYGDGTLDDVISAADQADGIVITWRSFGSGHVRDWSRDPVTEQYQYAAPALWNKGWGVKTLFRFDANKWKLGIHRPKMKNKVLQTRYPENISWLNGSGLPMEDYFKYRGWRSIRRTVGYDWLQMNHYAVKSMDAYALRKMRGNVNNKKDKYNSDYWSLQDRNEVLETSILRHTEKRAAIMAELLKDPVLSELHFKALENVEARLDEYRKTPAYEELINGLVEASKVPITQVTAKPPQARDPAKIASLMSSIEKKDAAKPKNERRSSNPEYNMKGGGGVYLTGKIDLTSHIEIESIPNHNILLPADPRVFTSDALDIVTKGKFERRDARHIAKYINSSDRLLDIGTGISFISIFACKTYPDLVTMAQEERKTLTKLGEAVAKTNGLDQTDRLKFVDGPLVFSTDADEQASGLQAYINGFNPSVLRIGDPRIGPEILSQLDPKNIQLIIFASSIQTVPTDQITNAMKQIGFAIQPDSNNGLLTAVRQPKSI